MGMDSLKRSKIPPGKTEQDSIARQLLGKLLSRWIGSREKSYGLNVEFLICLLIICGLAAFVGAVPTRMSGQDNFFLLDNGWRIVCGQRPHLDFFSP